MIDIIDRPDVFWNLILPLLILISGGIISIILSIKINDIITTFFPLILAFIIMVVLLSSPNTELDEWNEQVQLQIDTAKCSDLPILFDGYKEASISVYDNILDEIILRCLMNEDTKMELFVRSKL